MAGRLICVALGAVIWLVVPSEVPAEEFRIDTQVFVEDQEASVSESVTLFQDDVVYDFLDRPSRVAIFRRPTSDKPGRFILLDRERECRIEITTDRIEGAIEKVRTWAAQQRDPFLRFSASPQFSETYNPTTGELLLESPIQSYRVTTVPIEKAAAQDQLQDFLNWYARLNALVYSGPPPQPRLELNAALARHALMPLEVELTTSGKGQNLRAVHVVGWRLSKQDRARIDAATNDMASFREVSHAEFHQSQEPAAP